MADVPGIYIDSIVAFGSAESQPPRYATVLINSPGSLVGEFQYLMQAWDSVTNQQYDWLSLTRDFTGIGYPGPNSPVNIAVAGIVINCP